MPKTSEKITEYGVYVLVLKGMKYDFATDAKTVSFAICICKLSLQFINRKIKRLSYNINHYA